jgi:hypothetical protein
VALAFPAFAPYEIGTVTAFRARWLCWLVALLAALPLAGPGADRFFCRGMGVVLSACCCGARAHERAARAEVERRASVEAPSCCQRIHGASSAVALALSQRDGGSPAALQLLATAPSWPTFAAAPEARDVALEPVEARAPPPRGPPLFLENCVLLI